MADERKDPEKLSGREVLTEPSIPPELITGPPEPAGLERGWYLERGPFLIFARILSDEEARKIHLDIMPSKDSPNFKPSFDYISTIMELSVTNRSQEAVKVQWTREFKMTVMVHDDMYHPREPKNPQYKSWARKRLGTDHPVTKALTTKNITLEPGQVEKRLHVFTQFKKTKSLVPEMINRVYAGDWPLWPNFKEALPPVVRVPYEGVVKLVMMKAKPQEGKEFETVEKGALLGGTNELGDEIEFLTDQPAKVRLSDGVGFARVTAVRTGDRGLLGAGGVNKVVARARGVSQASNPIPTWDPRMGAPEGPFPEGKVVRRWLAKVDKNECLVSAAGERFTITAQNVLWALDSDCQVTHFIPIGWYPYSICLPKADGPVYMGRSNSVSEIDLDKGRIDDIVKTTKSVEDVCMRSDGTLVALLQGKKLVRIDTEACKPLETWDVKGQKRVMCSTKEGTDVMLVSLQVVELTWWNDY